MTGPQSRRKGAPVAMQTVDLHAEGFVQLGLCCTYDSRSEVPGLNDPPGKRSHR